MTWLILFGPAALAFIAVFAMVDMTADPGGVWPPVFVALFSALPAAAAVFILSGAFLFVRMLWRSL